jgi:tetratricopeptide (TPR) repeat protein
MAKQKNILSAILKLQKTKTFQKHLNMKILFLILIPLLFSSFILAQVPADSTAYFKKMVDDYRKIGFPEEGVQIMVQAERERLYPDIAKKAKAKRDAEGIKRARANSDDSETEDEDEEAQKMMDEAIRKMGQNPDEVNKKMSEIPDSKLNEIPKLSTRQVVATPSNEPALVTYLSKLQQKAETAISPAKKAKATQYLGKGRETGYAAVAFWINKEHDLALYLMLEACLEVPKDQLLLSNFATCLSMSGLPEKAIPILDYVLNKLPDNATVLNNLGQAWLSIGNIDKAMPLLEKAVLKDDLHPEANRSLARIAIKKGNTAQAIACLQKGLTGAFDSETYNQWSKLAAGKDVAELIRANHKINYKEVPITKRWIMPKIPTSVAEAQENEQDIQQFFADLDATHNDMLPKIEELKNAAFEWQNKQFMQMQQQSSHMKSLDDVQRYKNQFGNLFHPYKLQAQLMLNSIRSNDFATSYYKRIEQAVANRKERLDEMNRSLKSSRDQILELEKAMAGFEGGENGDDELKIRAIEKQICILRKEIQVAELTQLAEINSQYMKMVEDILNQRMQEEMYWTALYDIPNDPSGDLYSLYETYLSDLYQFRSLYPLPAPMQINCDETEDKHKATNVNGNLQLWEDSHCPIDIHYNVIIAEGKMNCREISISGKFDGVSVGWDRKIDPVTWETLEHSISISGGVKEFETEFTDRIKGKVGVEGKVTVKLNGDLIPTDIIVKAGAGAELSGPMGGKAGTDLGNVEISVQGGMRGEGPVPQLVGRMFGN